MVIGRKRGWNGVARGCAAVVLAVAFAVPGAWGQHIHASARRHHKVTLAASIHTLLAEPKVEGAHWGISVTRMDGTPVYALNDDKLFQPASNVKLFTTAAALGLVGGDKTWKTTARVDGYMAGTKTAKGDVTIFGDGDAYLSDRPVPYNVKTETFTPTLAVLDSMATQLAKSLIQSGITTVDGDVIGESLYAWQPYGEGWNNDDLAWGYGAPVSGLVVNDNQLQLTVTPGPRRGPQTTLTLAPDMPYYTIENKVVTGEAKSATVIEVERTERALRITGSIAIDAPSDIEQIAIGDPEAYVAMAFKIFLEQHGITVTGKSRSQHSYALNNLSTRETIREPLDLEEMKVAGPPIVDSMQMCGSGCDRSGKNCFDSCATLPRELAYVQHESPQLIDDVVITNKVSQNLHAELLLRKLAEWPFVYERGKMTFAQGARRVRQFAVNAGVGADDFYFVDGSGLSTYDVATPRAFTTLLRYAVGQPWEADWKASLPVGGVDGTLEHRFTEAPLKGKVFAKTGTLSEDRALSGYLVCASGKTVVFSILVGNHLPGSHEDREVMDKIVAAIAAAN